MSEQKGFLSENNFSRDKFLSPPLGYAPVYTWLWNDAITAEETEKQLNEMHDLGIKRFYVLPMPKDFRPDSQPSRLEPDYLSDEFFKEYRRAVISAAEMGMEVWLYDEGGWPSGGACGKVTKNRPELVREILKKRTVRLRKGRPYRLNGSAAAFVGEKRIRDGEKFDRNVTVTEYYKASVKSEYADIPDLTKKESAEEFLRLTHDRYAEAVGDMFGDVITAVFCDEPTGPRPFAYREDLDRAFFEQTGTDIKDFFPYLTRRADMSERARTVVNEWYDFLAQTFADSYLKTEKAWCKKHGLVFLGHMDKDDCPDGSLTGGSYDILRALSCLDAPGVDAISRQIFPPRKGACLPKEVNSFFPRIASSAASQTGGRHALTESFAVYGNGLTFEEMRFALDFQAMRGINVFNPMLFSYGRTGYLRTGELPHFAASHACFADLSVFNGYAERLSYLFSLGERVVSTALYLPLSDIRVGENKEVCEDYVEAGKELEKAGISFDIINDFALSKADKTVLERGVIAIGKARYDAVVLPLCRNMPEESKVLLERFKQGGGKVLSRGEYSCLKPVFSFEHGDGFSLAESRTEGGRMVFIMNENALSSDCAVRSEKKYYHVDVTNGKIFKPDEPEYKITLFSGEIAALYFTDEEIETDLRSDPKGERLIEKWTFRKTKRFLIGKEDFRMIEYNKQSKKCAPGDWKKYVGRGFSGSGEYRTTFEGKEWTVLDLGRVAYVGEAILNGVSLGVKVFPPYRYDLPKELLRDNNELVVRVTNTVANEFERTMRFRKYKKRLLTRYLKEEKIYHKESFPSGLFGPIKLLF